MRYTVVFETVDGSVSAFLPDMPGVGVVGGSRLEALQLLDKAVQWHVEDLIRRGDPIPEPSSADLPVGTVTVQINRTFVQSVAEGLQTYVNAPPTESAVFAAVSMRLSALRIVARDA